MSCIETQEDFVRLAELVYGKTYDYREVIYTKSFKKVKIVCAKHGVFEQTPNKHICGFGCPVCGVMPVQVRMDAKEFVRRSQLIHDGRYDYSKVVYAGLSKRVCIVCSEHGEFWQTPHGHVNLGQGCPKCGRRLAGQKRMGDNNPMRKESAKIKAKATCLAKYGAKTYAESDEGRKKLHDIITSDDVQSRTQATCLARYGAKTWSESVSGRQRLHEIMSSDDMRERIRDGYCAVYGVDHFMKTDTGREIARTCISSPERRAAIEQAIADKYGVRSTMQLDWVKDKSRSTVQHKYHVSHVAQCPDIMARCWATRRRNGTYNKSSPESTFHLMLNDIFGSDNVLTQYADDPRYPFHVDFYLPGPDVFIELNITWTHGGHWFDANNPLDVLKLEEWQSKAKLRGSKYYKDAIKTWTVRDVEKREVAIRNGLNYFVFWDSNLADAKAWLASL